MPDLSKAVDRLPPAIKNKRWATMQSRVTGWRVTIVDLTRSGRAVFKVEDVDLVEATHEVCSLWEEDA